MSEIIVRLTSDHIKVKGGEYVQDLVRCRECKHYAEHNELYINAPTNCVKHSTINHYVAVNADDFCSYGEVRDE